jgi:hypothetical protein
VEKRPINSAKDGPQPVYKKRMDNHKEIKMALEGLKRVSSRMLIKPKSAGPWDEISEKEKGKYHDGVGLCGHYDVELDALGYCRDEECRRDRFLKALYDGEAMKMSDGTIIWTPGFKIQKG